MGAEYLTYLGAQAGSLRQLGEDRSPLLAELPPGLTPAHLGVDAPRLPVADVRRRLQEALLGAGDPVLHLDLTGASLAAQTALLAICEALPSGLVLILFTSEPDAVLATVRSRCYHWRLPPLPRPVFEQLLVQAGATALQAGALPNPYPGTLAEAVHETRTDRGPIDALLRALALRDPVASLTACEGFAPPQALLLAIQIRRHLSNLSPMPVFTMLRLPTPVLTAWVEALTHHDIPPPAAARWGCLLALTSRS